VEELEIPELTTEQIETLCTTAENAARKHVLSRISSKNIEKLNVSVEAEGSKPINLSIDVDLELAPQVKDADVKALADEAAKAALRASENYLRMLK
jgi:FKBP-type peptidyl-prolyl cis-trans isomerase (trigger factor)